MGLYQKHRPQALDEVVGNKQIISVLSNTLRNKTNVPHAFLFHGPTGCGKTTLARIVATQLGCSQNNIIEIDTAQFNGIDTVRDIRTKAQYTPFGGGSRTYIIDEVHRMTTDAQNAFLKILEDSPKHTYFILCTTNEKSLLATIRGRCSQFQVSLLTDKEMTSLIADVVAKENESVTDFVIEAIVKSAQGHPRNALTILDQVLQTPEKRREKVAKQVQVIENESIELARALLANKGWNTVKEILKGLKSEEPETIRRVIIGYMNVVLLSKYDEQALHVLESFEEPTYNMGFPAITLACGRALQK